MSRRGKPRALRFSESFLLPQHRAFHVNALAVSEDNLLALMSDDKVMVVDPVAMLDMERMSPGFTSASVVLATLTTSDVVAASNQAGAMMRADEEDHSMGGGDEDEDLEEEAGAKKGGRGRKSAKAKAKSRAKAKSKAGQQQWENVEDSFIAAVKAADKVRFHCVVWSPRVHGYTHQANADGESTGVGLHKGCILGVGTTDGTFNLYAMPGKFLANGVSKPVKVLEVTSKFLEYKAAIPLYRFDTAQPHAGPTPGPGVVADWLKVHPSTTSPIAAFSPNGFDAFMTTPAPTPAAAAAPAVKTEIGKEAASPSAAQSTNWLATETCVLFAVAYEAVIVVWWVCPGRPKMKIGCLLATCSHPTDHHVRVTALKMSPLELCWRQEAADTRPSLRLTLFGGLSNGQVLAWQVDMGVERKADGYWLPARQHRITAPLEIAPCSEGPVADLLVGPCIIPPPPQQPQQPEGAAPLSDGGLCVAIARGPSILLAVRREAASAASDHHAHDHGAVPRDISGSSGLTTTTAGGGSYIYHLLSPTLTSDAHFANVVGSSLLASPACLGDSHPHTHTHTANGRLLVELMSLDQFGSLIHWRVVHGVGDDGMVLEGKMDDVRVVDTKRGKVDGLTALEEGVFRPAPSIPSTFRRTVYTHKSARGYCPSPSGCLLFSCYETDRELIVATSLVPHTPVCVAMHRMAHTLGLANGFVWPTTTTTTSTTSSMRSTHQQLACSSGSCSLWDMYLAVNGPLLSAILAPPRREGDEVMGAFGFGLRPNVKKEREREREREWWEADDEVLAHSDSGASDGATEERKHSDMALRKRHLGRRVKRLLAQKRHSTAADNTDPSQLTWEGSDKGGRVLESALFDSLGGIDLSRPHEAADLCAVPQAIPDIPQTTNAFCDPGKESTDDAYRSIGPATQCLGEDVNVLSDYGAFLTCFLCEIDRLSGPNSLVSTIKALDATTEPPQPMVALMDVEMTDEGQPAAAAAVVKKEPGESSPSPRASPSFAPVQQLLTRLRGHLQHLSAAAAIAQQPAHRVSALQCLNALRCVVVPMARQRREHFAGYRDDPKDEAEDKELLRHMLLAYWWCVYHDFIRPFRSSCQLSAAEEESIARIEHALQHKFCVPQKHVCEFNKSAGVTSWAFDSIVFEGGRRQAPLCALTLMPLSTEVLPEYCALCCRFFSPASHGRPFWANLVCTPSTCPWCGSSTITVW